MNSAIVLPGSEWLLDFILGEFDIELLIVRENALCIKKTSKSYMKQIYIADFSFITIT